MNTGGSQPELAALAFTTSERNVAHWAPSGTAMITSGAFEAIEFTCAVGGAVSAASIVCWSTISKPASPANSSIAST